MTDLADRPTSVPRWQRRLLPGELLEASGTGRSARDWIVDVAIFAAAVALGVVTLSTSWSDHNTAGVLIDVVLGTLACLALWLRRTHPVGVGVLGVSAGAISSLASGAAPFALFGVAVRGSRRALVILAALALVAVAIFPAIYPSTGNYNEQFLFGLLVVVVAIGWGLFTRVRRELVISLRDRAERLESEQQLRVTQAREAERRRIAREMHDVLAHRISLLSVHAGALEFRPDAPAQEVAEAAGVIRATAQTALQELRDVIGVLREDAEEGTPEPPQPTIAQIPALIEESRAAGMRVSWREDVPDQDAIPYALGRTAYRVVQEGLTNARKHAPAAAVEVTVSANSRPALVVEVISRRAIGEAQSNSLPGTGTGLVGLAERVALAGGELEHGPEANGDFVLRATLAWTP
jgi:signal transduction histidine kinase